MNEPSEMNGNFNTKTRSEAVAVRRRKVNGTLRVVQCNNLINFFFRIHRGSDLRQFSCGNRAEAASGRERKFRHSDGP
jgi:hypothetical protein